MLEGYPGDISMRIIERVRFTLYPFSFTLDDCHLEQLCAQSSKFANGQIVSYNCTTAIVIIAA